MDSFSEGSSFDIITLVNVIHEFKLPQDVIYK